MRTQHLPKQSKKQLWQQPKIELFTFRKTHTMKKSLFYLLLIFSSYSVAQNCVNGFAGIYPCNNIDLKSHLTFAQIGGNNTTTEGSGCWGWTDPLTGREYAIMGCSTHTAFVDITNPISPVYKGKVLAHNNTTSIWREISVINNHALIVSETAGHGMQIFDLTRLRNVTTPQVFAPDARYAGFGNCHTVSSNPATGFVYCDGTNLVSGGPQILNMQNPVAPLLAGSYDDEGYTHDAQIVVYNGPDPDYQGREIFMGANDTKVAVIDVTNKTNPVTISNFFYDNNSYAHQGWFTPDQKYWILSDELDELNFGFNGRSIIIDMTDLDNPVLKGEYYGTTPAIDHNGYIIGNNFFLASYTAGLRIMNTSTIATSGTMNEIAFFDTYPSTNAAQFNGVWNTYPFFASGSIIMSDIDTGLYIVKKSASLSIQDFEKNSIKLSPNPANNFVVIESPNKIESIEVFDIIGKKVKIINSINTNSLNLDVKDLNSGIYIVKVNNSTSLKLIVR
jgi:choice-of-anchor B domain-containing protein